jgi:DNA mismatch repair protein MutL
MTEPRPTIHVLPPHVANQIAAGEVVERPASVVKELVEIALDAGATQITVMVEEGGLKRLMVQDDGYGLGKDDLKLAVSRHATSKIKDAEDLFAINSFGFRGEALPSIASVSRMTIRSKMRGSQEAWALALRGSDVESLKPASHPEGTSIEILDLFFNTPARR